MSKWKTKEKTEASQRPSKARHDFLWDGHSPFCGDHPAHLIKSPARKATSKTGPFAAKSAGFGKTGAFHGLARASSIRIPRRRPIRPYPHARRGAHAETMRRPHSKPTQRLGTNISPEQRARTGLARTRRFGRRPEELGLGQTRKHDEGDEFEVRKCDISPPKTGHGQRSPQKKKRNLACVQSVSLMCWSFFKFPPRPRARANQTPHENAVSARSVWRRSSQSD